METVCSEPSCTRKVRSRGMCGSHYETWRKENRSEVGKAPVKSRWNNPDGSRMTCMRPNCEKPIVSQGMCKHHYQNMHYESTRGSTKTKKNRKLTDYDGVKKKLFCTFEGCNRPEFNPGLCAGHYYQKLKGHELSAIHETAPCPVPGCEAVYYTKKSKTGLCARHAALRGKYSLSSERLIEMFTGPECMNPNCRSSETLSIDHDHSCCPGQRSCGECVRGLLCRNCNTTLGLLDDDPQKMEGLLRYLERYQ